jgi:hypothetical protein
MDLLSSLFFWVISASITLTALFFVIRAAVLSALREHRAELQQKTRPVSHLDADGL